MKRGFLFNGSKNYTEERLELMVLNTLPMMGPRIIKAAITTIATKTRIKAYSTKPWPFSLGENNMINFSFLSKMFKETLEVFLFYIAL